MKHSTTNITTAITTTIIIVVVDKFLTFLTNCFMDIISNKIKYEIHIYSYLLFALSFLKNL